MSDTVQEYVFGIGKWVIGGAMSVVFLLGSQSLTEIKETMKSAVDAQNATNVRLARIEEQTTSSNNSALKQAAQMESLRTELIDLRMRVNTLETKVK